MQWKLRLLSEFNSILFPLVLCMLQTYSNLDLMDGHDVSYFGRTDLQLMTEINNGNIHIIYNCATLSFVRPEFVRTEDEMEYSGVGFSVRNCKSNRFLCHGQFYEGVYDDLIYILIECRFVGRKMNTVIESTIVDEIAVWILSVTMYCYLLSDIIIIENSMSVRPSFQSIEIYVLSQTTQCNTIYNNTMGPFGIALSTCSFGKIS